MYDVIIIGAGSAGLSARSVIAKHTENYLVIDNGPLGTTCARTGCMPAKSFIMASKMFKKNDEAFEHTRKLRDEFVRGVKEGMTEWADKFIQGYATFQNKDTVIVNEKVYQAKSFILAVGSRPFIPEKWKEYKEYFLTTEEFFELEELPSQIGVIGLGPVGLELAQAISRFPVELKTFSHNEVLARVEDNELQKIAKDKFLEDFEIHIGEVDLEVRDNKLIIKSKDIEYSCSKAVVSVGRVSNVDKLGLEVSLDSLKSNYSLEEYPHIYIVGDANNRATILHEAHYEGRAAAHSILDKLDEIKPMTDMGIIFTDPQIAYVGKPNDNDIQGMTYLKHQGRSKINGTDYGAIKVFFDKKSNTLKGAKVISHDAEFIVHFLAVAIENKMTRDQLLNLPYYHPTILEAVKTAIIKAK